VFTQPLLNNGCFSGSAILAVRPRVNIIHEGSNLVNITVYMDAYISQQTDQTVFYAFKDSYPGRPDALSRRYEAAANFKSYGPNSISRAQPLKYTIS
jgi:hypothetical protein